MVVLTEKYGLEKSVVGFECAGFVAQCGRSVCMKFKLGWGSFAVSWRKIDIPLNLPQRAENNGRFTVRERRKYPFALGYCFQRLSTRSRIETRRILTKMFALCHPTTHVNLRKPSYHYAHTCIRAVHLYTAYANRRSSRRESILHFP